MSKTESRPRLTAARKFELYLATRGTAAPVGELLRQYGVHLDDLRAIEHTVEQAALTGLKGHGHHPLPAAELSPVQTQQLQHDLAEKTQALAELSVSYTLLEKKDRAESRASMWANGSRRRSSK
jgi:hypothetical protein